MAVLLYTVDLGVISRIEGAAARTGLSVRAVSSEAAAVESCDSSQPGTINTIVIDLSTPSLDTASLVAKLKSADPLRIVAFGPHVHTDKLAAARAAGCDVVVSRGEFFANIERVLAGG